MDKKQIGAWITAHEGYREKVYFDTEKHPTIGVGFNLDRPDAKDLVKGLGLDYEEVRTGEQNLSNEQITHLFQHDLDNAIADAQKLFSNFEELPADKQMVLIDMSFNMGYDQLSGFSKMIDAVNKNDWESAAKEMIDSKWYDQVGDRGLHNVEVMQEGLEKNLDKYEAIFDQHGENFQKNPVEFLDTPEIQYADQPFSAYPETFEVADNSALKEGQLATNIGDYLDSPETITENLVADAMVTTQQEYDINFVSNEAELFVEHTYGTEYSGLLDVGTLDNLAEDVYAYPVNEADLNDPVFEVEEVVESSIDSQADSIHYEESLEGQEKPIETIESSSHEHYVNDSGMAS